ncbi:MAG: TetR/AcrR family transcriptional regulator [Myxococcota bacterium]|nr:TetR/AcrR family transcriptional regulator [Myxococcota bacterium]
MPRTLTAEQVQDFRHELCDVAAQRFARDGYDAVTMRELAADLGVSPMTPYRYFEGKADIYKEVRTQAFARFAARVADAAAGVSDPLHRLRALFHAYLGFALDEPGAYRIMFELEPPKDADLDHEAPEPSGDAWSPLLQTLEEAAKAGLVEGDPLTLANLCWVHVHGLASLHIAGRLRFDRCFDDLVEPLFHTQLHGILSRPDQG